MSYLKISKDMHSCIPRLSSAHDVPGSVPGIGSTVITKTAQSGPS